MQMKNWKIYYKTYFTPRSCQVKSKTEPTIEEAIAHVANFCYSNRAAIKIVTIAEIPFWQ